MLQGCQERHVSSFLTLIIAFLYGIPLKFATIRKPWLLCGSSWGRYSFSWPSVSARTKNDRTA